MKMKIGAPALSVLTLACAAAFARADDDVGGRFDIPPQALDSALRQFADQAGLQLVFESRLTSGQFISPEIRGQWSNDQALGKLLEGTGLGYVVLDAKTIAIFPAIGTQALQLLEGSGEVARGTDRLGLRLAQTRSVPASGAAVEAGAADEVSLQEVVVTAERRESNVQRTAASVAVRDGGQLAREGKYSLNQVLEDVPGVSGVTYSGLGGGGFGSDAPENGIAIRGVRSNTGNTSFLVGSSTTALYVDGVYGGVGSGYDIERVEVLRGPQGTLYGRSATGGVVAIKTRDPDVNAFGGDAAAEFGSYELQHYTAALNVPVISDKLAVRFSGNHYQRKGYDHPQGDATKTSDARIKILAKPIDDLSVLFGFAQQWNTVHSGGVIYNASGLRTYYADPAPVGTSNNDFLQYWAEIKWDLPVMTVTYLPSVRSWEQQGKIYGPAPGGGVIGVTVGHPHDRYTMHELHLTSAANSRLSWQVGATYFNQDVKGFTNESRYVINNALFNSRGQDRTIDEVGLFAEATYPIWRNTRFTTGFRHDNTDVNTSIALVSNDNRLRNPGTVNVGLPLNLQSYSVSGDAGHATFKSNTYKLRLEHDLSESSLLYGLVATGFVPGDVQVNSSIPPQTNYYDAQELTSYEIGSKNRFLGERLQVNSAAFFYDYGGYQTNVTPNLADPTNQIFVVTPAKMTGLELELLYQFTAHDRIGLDASYVDARWVDSPPGFRTAVALDRIWGIPPIKISASYNHDFPLPGGSILTFRADARYRSSYEAASLSTAQLSQGARPYIEVEPQVIGNLSLDWNSANGRFGLGGYVRNVTDNRYVISYILQSVSPLSQTVRLYEPRTWGFIGRVKF